MPITTTPQRVLDRASCKLQSQLLSTQTIGTFTTDTLVNLGSQTWEDASSDFYIVTFEDEQIKCNCPCTVVGGVATHTIAASGRGWNDTVANTHAAGTTGYLNVNSATIQNLQDQIDASAAFVNSLEAADVALNATGLLPYATPTTIVSASSHTVAGDKTALFTRGRVFLFKVSGAWHRAVVVTSAYTSLTTVTLNGSSLPATGTVTECGFEASLSAHAPMTMQLIADSAEDPATTPPSGYVWLYSKAGVVYTKNSSGAVANFGALNSTQVTDLTDGGFCSIHHHVWAPVASDTLRVSSNGEVYQVYSLTYVKRKEITLVGGGVTTGTVKVSFEAYVNASWDARARVYVNGVAVGPEHVLTQSWVTYTDTVAASGRDAIQIYLTNGGNNGGYYSRVKNMHVSFDMAESALGSETFSASS